MDKSIGLDPPYEGKVYFVEEFLRERYTLEELNTASRRPQKSGFILSKVMIMVNS